VSVLVSALWLVPESVLVLEVGVLVVQVGLAKTALVGLAGLVGMASLVGRVGLRDLAGLEVLVDPQGPVHQLGLSRLEGPVVLLVLVWAAWVLVVQDDLSDLPGLEDQDIHRGLVHLVGLAVLVSLLLHAVV